MTEFSMGSRKKPMILHSEIIQSMPNHRFDCISFITDDLTIGFYHEFIFKWHVNELISFARNMVLNTVYLFYTEWKDSMCSIQSEKKNPKKKESIEMKGKLKLKSIWLNGKVAEKCS